VYLVFEFGSDKFKNKERSSLLQIFNRLKNNLDAPNKKPRTLNGQHEVCNKKLDAISISLTRLVASIFPEAIIFVASPLILIDLQIILGTWANDTFSSFL